MVLKKALITGCAGQLGSYLSEHLADSGYSVYGTTKHAPDLPSDADITEVYVLHITRPLQELGMHVALRSGLVEVARILDLYPAAQVLVPDSHARLAGKGPASWILDKDLTRKFAAHHCPRLVMPTLHQFISPRGNPQRMYLMWILHELAKGRVPAPRRPLDVVHPEHAKNGAFLLAEGMQGRWGALPAPPGMTVQEFIQRAQEPGDWIHQIVVELRGEGK